MPKSQRLMELMMEVNRKRSFTAQELADQFQVSRRTMLRDLRELEAIGVPLYAEPGPRGGYRVLRERLLPPIAFTEEEAAAIFFAYQSLQQYEELPFEAETKAALHKFYSYLPHDVKDRIDRMAPRVKFKIPKRPKGSPHLKTLLEAALAQTVLDVEYDSRDGVTRRDIQPIGIFASQGFWYCPAYCHGKKDIRLFRADRFLAVRLAEGFIGERQDLSGIHLGNWEAELSRAADWVDIDIELTREGVRRCQSEEWIAPHIREREDGSGRYTGRIPEREIPYFASFFLGVGAEAHIKKPAVLIEQMKSTVDTMRSRYGWS